MWECFQNANRKHEGRRLIGKPRLSCEDNVGMCLKKYKSIGWIGLILSM